MRSQAAFGFAVVCRRGVAPVADVLPLQGAIPFKRSRGGTQGVVHFVHFTLGLDTIAFGEVRLHLSRALESQLSSLCIRFALTLLCQVRLRVEPHR
nr:MAG TPA: hypothetical protein [Caudoviricetes sp.]